MSEVVILFNSGKIETLAMPSEVDARRVVANIRDSMAAGGLWTLNDDLLVIRTTEVAGAFARP